MRLEDFARTKNLLKDFGRNVSRRARTNLTKGDHNVKKKLYNSLSSEIKVDKEGQSIAFSYEFYGEFQDKGIKGWKSSAKAPESPFQYKKKFANFGAIEGWVRARRFQFRDRKSGKFMSYKSTAWLISRSVAAKGIKPTKWFSEAFDKYFVPMVIEFEERLAKDLEDLLLKDL